VALVFPILLRLLTGGHVPTEQSDNAQHD